MKKKLLAILFLLNFCWLGFVNAQNPVTNPGFETWVGGNPVGWFTNNIPGFGVPITQGAPHNGAHSMRGDVINGVNGVVSPAVFNMGFHVMQNFAYLNFYYQFNKVGNGFLDAGGVLYDNIGSPIAGASQDFTTSVTSYTMASIPFSYVGGNADSGFVVFSIGDQINNDPDVGNYFLIDDVSLSGLVGVEEPLDNKTMTISKIQPNPVNDFAYIYYSLPSNDNLKFELYNIDGKTCETIVVLAETAGKHKIELNVGELPGGVYLLHMSATNAFASAKVIVVR